MATCVYKVFWKTTVYPFITCSEYKNTDMKNEANAFFVVSLLQSCCTKNFV